jgi:O-glycosyl hydrolase
MHAKELVVHPTTCFKQSGRANYQLFRKEFYMRKIMFLLGLVSALVIAGCTLDVNDPVRSIPIIKPYISVQPLSFAYNLDAMDGVEWPPVLEVKVEEWRSADGSLSYQWYTFEDYASYLADGGGGAISGATGTSYTLPLDLAALSKGERYYYYVEVKNHYDDAVGPTDAKIQSAVSIVSFYDNTMAPIPVVIQHPVSADYQIGRAAIISPLEVLAEVPEGGIISYRWYTNTTYSSTGGTAIIGPEAAEPSYLPESLKKGDNFFYVVITNTVTTDAGTITSTETCLPVNLLMKPGERAETPRITLQPKDQTVFAGEPITALTIDANETPSDNGTITYQWYQANGAADTATRVQRNNVWVWDITPVTSTRIDGATTKSYLPTVSNATAAKFYFYAEAINTSDDVIDTTPVRTRSKIATVAVADSGTRSANVILNIPDPSNPDNRYQYIRGYGGMDVAWANFPQTTAADTHLMYNPDWGLGYNINRYMIVPPGTNDPNYSNHHVIIQKLLNEHRPDYLENVKITNQYGGYVLASPWTPPKEWKTNNSINSGGHLIPAYYNNFAAYLKSYAQYMYSRGAPVYAVSIANEPNYAGGYDGCEWEPDQMRDFFKKVGHFTDGVRGYGGGVSTPVVLTVNGESANTPGINNSALNDAASRSVIDFYARHVYGEQTVTLWNNSYAKYKEGATYQGIPVETECWMTEHNINSANPTAFVNDSTWNYIWRFMNDVDLVIRLNNENAFVWWASKRFYSFVGDGQSGTTDGAALPRGLGLSHYAKYSIDTRRIAVNVDPTSTTFDNRPITNTGLENSLVNSSAFSLDNLSAKITAFVSRDGNEISLVMYTPTMTNGTQGVDLGTIQINMPDGFEIGSVQAVRSQGPEVNQAHTSRMFQPYEVTIAEDRQSAYVELRRSMLLSVKFTR